MGRRGGRVNACQQMKYSLTFLMLAVACVVSTLAAWNVVGWLGIPLLYLAFSFFMLAAAYAGVGPGLFLKTRSGCRSFAGWVLLGPYFLLNDLILALYCMLSREPAYGQAAPNVFFGRRLSAAECGAVGWVSVLDLAVELAEARPLRALPGYRSLPVLDTTAPTEEQMRSALDWLGRAVGSGPVYVHCALGHGRSVCVVIAYLLAIGEVVSISEGVERLRSLRPGVRLTPAQKQRLLAFEPRQRDSSPNTAAADRLC